MENMDFYQDICLSVLTDIPLADLQSHVYNEIHFALVRLGATDIALSFPEAEEKNLGLRFRIHGSCERLVEMNRELTFPVFLREYAVKMPVSPVPAGRVTGWQTVARRHPKNSFENRARRWMKRHPGEPIPAFPAQKPLELPKVFLKSSSSSGKWVTKPTAIL